MSILDRHESALVGAAMRGDTEAVRALWQDNRRWVAAVILAHKPRESDVEDLLQDVAMTFVRSIGTLRDEGVFRPWLRTVAINAARAQGRQQTRRKLRDRAHAATFAIQADGSASTSSPQRSGESGNSNTALEEGDRLLELASTLPDGYKEPLLLRCVRGMSYKQIAELTGLPESTIETRIARGRRMLREMAARSEETTGVES